MTAAKSYWQFCLISCNWAAKKNTVWGCSSQDFALAQEESSSTCWGTGSAGKDSEGCPSCHSRLEHVIGKRISGNLCLEETFNLGISSSRREFVHAESLFCSLCCLPHLSETLLEEMNAGCSWFCVRVKLRLSTSLD